MKLERHEKLTFGDYLVVGALAAPAILVVAVVIIMRRFWL